MGPAAREVSAQAVAARCAVWLCLPPTAACSLACLFLASHPSLSHLPSPAPYPVPIQTQIIERDETRTASRQAGKLEGATAAAYPAPPPPAPTVTAHV